jgi:hypothetical protein
MSLMHKEKNFNHFTGCVVEGIGGIISIPIKPTVCSETSLGII